VATLTDAHVTADAEPGAALGGLTREEERMPRMIAYCGLVCPECPTYLATRADDDAARARTAAMYAEKFGFDLRPEEIDCDGCRSDGGTLMAYCRACVIRECCHAKGFENCALCPDQPCESLAEFHAFSPGGKASFDALREQLG